MSDVTDATEYLVTGGLGEVLGLASLSLRAGLPKVQMDTDMAIALCMLANLAIAADLHLPSTNPEHHNEH